MHSAVVLDRKDLCDNIQDLPFNLVEWKHFKKDECLDIATIDVAIFIDGELMKMLKNRDGKCSIWTIQKATRSAMAHR